MARRTTRRAGAGRARSTPTDPREAAIAALMDMLAERPFRQIGLANIAERSGVSLADLRGLYGGKLGILAEYTRRIDTEVLAGGAVEGESARDRMFDILMRRLDAMAPHKAGLRGLSRSARCEPGLACALALMAQRSMRWMLAGAGVGEGGIMGKVATRGAALVFAETLAVWVDDDDPALARTMATLDRALRRGDRIMGYVADACDFARSFRPGTRRGGAEDAGAAI